MRGAHSLPEDPEGQVLYREITAGTYVEPGLLIIGVIYSHFRFDHLIFQMRDAGCRMQDAGCRMQDA
ncbi:MAG: hypothetical protein WCO02_16750, partial [Bacteroidota bacterium]